MLRHAEHTSTVERKRATVCMQTSFQIHASELYIQSSMQVANNCGQAIGSMDERHRVVPGHGSAKPHEFSAKLHRCSSHPSALKSSVRTSQFRIATCNPSAGRVASDSSSTSLPVARPNCPRLRLRTTTCTTAKHNTLLIRRLDEGVFHYIPAGRAPTR